MAYAVRVPLGRLLEVAKSLAVGLVGGLFVALILGYIGRAQDPWFSLALLMVVFLGPVLALVSFGMLVVSPSHPGFLRKALRVFALSLACFAQVISLRLGLQLQERDSATGREWLSSRMPALDKFKIQAGVYPRDKTELWRVLGKAPPYVEEHVYYYIEDGAIVFELPGTDFSWRDWKYSSKTGKWFRVDMD